MPSLTMSSIAAVLWFTLITGAIYPLAVTLGATALFPRQATGSLIVRDGHAVGSALIGQYTDNPANFWGRPSATSPFPDNAAASSGSNLGPSNPALIEAVKTRISALRAADSASRTPVPADLVLASGSGLDPHISPAAAYYQVRRVARTRGLDTAAVSALIRDHTEGRQLGMLGEARVNVLELNLALERLGAAR